MLGCGGAAANRRPGRELAGTGEMLRIGRQVLEEIEAHMEETYPNECCGLIIGAASGGVRTGVRSWRCGNLNTERAVDRYQLDPMDMLRAQQALEGSDEDIVGIYHSHPDHPSRPSEFDRDHAWSGWSYMIGSVMSGKVESVQSWELDEAAHRFNEEPVEVEEEKVR
jgi:proteasome lid subunit RPN8/RPN11